MKRIRVRPFVLLCWLLGGVCQSLWAGISFVPGQTFRVYSAAPSATMVVSFYATASAGTVSYVNVRIAGTTYTADHVSDSTYVVSFTTSSFGALPVKGLMGTSTGMLDSTFSISLKLIHLDDSPVPYWSSVVSYNAGSYVTYGDSLYKARYYTQGDIPLGSEPWTNMGICSSQNYPTLDCSEVAAWNTTLVYGPYNNDINVCYDGVVYRASYYALALSPDSGAPWSFVAVCAQLNQLPQVRSSYVDTVILQSSLSPLTLQAEIEDADGDISDVRFVVDGVSYTPSLSGTSCTLAFTPSSYAIHELMIIATDDELGCDTLMGTFQIAGSRPPSVWGITPTQGQKVSTIYRIGLDTLLLSACSLDADGTVSSVTFTVDGTVHAGTQKDDSTYVFEWLPAAYGEHTLQVSVLDNEATQSVKTVSFSLENPCQETLDVSDLPLQLTVSLGYDKLFDFGENITRVVVRNRRLARVSYSGSQLTVSGNMTGRTGLAVSTTSGTYYVGLRINGCDGSVPGMPSYFSLGFKSQDIDADLAFWQQMDSDGTNKNMDVRYIYINGGPAVTGTFNSWRLRSRTTNYCRYSLQYGVIPFFVYYNLPDGGESYETDLSHMRNVAYMKEYFEDLEQFIDDCTSVMGEELFGIILEPDVLGYMQQLGVVNDKTNDPDELLTCVAADSIGTNIGTVHSLVDRINRTIQKKREAGANLYFGWQLNLWSAGIAGPLGLMRITDSNSLGWSTGRDTIRYAARSTMNYGLSCGITSHNADFVSIDKYGLDAQGYLPKGNINTNPWWFNNDHWDNYLLYAKTMHEVSGKDIILWQLPVGHINHSHYVSAYTGTTYSDLDNTTCRYEDSSVSYFFGDTFTPADSTLAYFSQNQAGDTLLSCSGDSISWGEHLSKSNACGIIHAMFGAGVGNSTDAIGNPPADSSFTIQKMQDYYDYNLQFLSSAPFTAQMLTFNVSHTAEDLSLYCPMSKNFMGNYCTYAGVFSPSVAGIGTHYVTYVDTLTRRSRTYHVQKIIVTDQTEGVASLSARQTFNLCANPVSNEGVIRICNPQGSLTVRLFSLTGQKVLFSVSEAQVINKLDVSGLAPGVYVVSLQMGDQTDCCKLVIRR
jgi:hypothetical protein